MSKNITCMSEIYLHVYIILYIFIVVDAYTWLTSPSYHSNLAYWFVSNACTWLKVQRYMWNCRLWTQKRQRVQRVSEVRTARWWWLTYSLTITRRQKVFGAFQSGSKSIMFDVHAAEISHQKQRDSERWGAKRRDNPRGSHLLVISPRMVCIEYCNKALILQFYCEVTLTTQTGKQAVYHPSTLSVEDLHK